MIKKMLNHHIIQKENTWHNKNIDQVFRELESNANGLTPEEASVRLKDFGYNELEEKKGTSPLILLLSQFKSLLIVILIIAAIVSAGMGEMVESIAIIIIVILAGVLGFLQEYKAGKAIEALKKMASPNATILRGGIELIIPAREVVPSDILFLKTGDKVPADARLIEVVNLQIDEASLTGESVPVEKTTVTLHEEKLSLGDRKNMAYTGTIVTYGRSKAVVVATGMHTEFGKIADMLQTTQKGKTPLQIDIDKVGKIIGVIAILLAAVMSVLGALKGYPFGEIFVWGVALAVAIIPEALPAVVTITLAIGVRRMAKRRALIGKLSAVETLGATTIICSDKTGTLTQGQMTVRRLYVNGQNIDVTGVGYTPVGDFHIDGVKFNPNINSNLLNLLNAATLCSDALLRQNDKSWEIFGDPTEGALIVAAAKAGIKVDDLKNLFPRIKEIPFSSERKRMTTIHKYPNGLQVFSKGAPEVILSSCSFHYEGEKIISLSDESRKNIINVAHKMGEEALRVLAVSTKSIDHIENVESVAENEMIFLGLAGMVDPPRLEAKEAIKTCEQAGIKPVMITGDHKITAVVVARELGILKNGKVFSGSELEDLSDTELDGVIDDTEVFTRISPAHKMRIVSAFMKKGHIVAMTGDGVNDAPSLKKADIGIGMGITGTDVSKEASDMILTDDNFASIVAAVEEGRSIFENIRKYLIFLLSGNAGTVFAIMIALAANLPLPLVAVQILFINFIMDGLIAIALGVEPPEPGIMSRKPRHSKEGILNRNGLTYIFSVGVLIAIVTTGVFVWALDSGFSNEKAMTMFFITLILARLFNGFNCRSSIDSIVKLGMFTNKPLIISMLISFGLSLGVIYIGILQTPFQTVGLLASELVIAFSAASTILIIVELWKRIRAIILVSEKR